MFKFDLLVFLVVSICLISQVSLEEFETDFSAADVFHVARVNTLEISFVELLNINDLLTARTKSTDPVENLDILLGELKLEDGGSHIKDKKSNLAKRMFVALTTLKGENLCNYYGYKILSNLHSVLGHNIRSLKQEDNLGRVEKILLHYIREHVKNCRRSYVDKFDQLSLNQDQTQTDRLKVLTGSSLEFLKSRPLYNKNNGDLNTLYNVVANGLAGEFDMEPGKIYEALIDLAKKDPDVKYLRPVEDEDDGVKKIHTMKVEKLFKEYVTKPCEYFRQRFGPDVFQPAEFDMLFDKEIKIDRADFFEAWVRYKLCNFR